MSVWLEPPAATLSGSAGELVSISIDLNPRDLESLLDALAHVSFPVNPQIYHEAQMVYVYPDGHQETEAVTLVEFPAYAGQLREVDRVLRAYEFDPAGIRVARMLDEIHAGSVLEPPPPGAPYAGRYRLKFPAVAAVGQVV
jgi:hypothetical protein